MIIKPKLALPPGVIRWTAGKSLDGGMWLDFEGFPRMNLSPSQAMDLATGLLKCLDIALEKVPTPAELQ